MVSLVGAETTMQPITWIDDVKGIKTVSLRTEGSDEPFLSMKITPAGGAA